jgi:HPt (histidine-containing phosphotransfer) domain-containing protein
MRGQMERCIASGMDDFLTKPIHRDQLRAIIGKHCHPAALHSTELDGVTTETLLETPVAATSPAVNVQRLKETADGDLEFMRELVQLYIEGSQPLLMELHAACTADDRAAVRRVAHKLKGASASIHAEQLVQVCGDLEHHPAELDQTALTDLLRQLESTLAAVVDELNTLMNAKQSAA